jgi:hypothetical protein
VAEDENDHADENENDEDVPSEDTWIEQPWDMALEFAKPICDEA